MIKVDTSTELLLQQTKMGVKLVRPSVSQTIQSEVRNTGIICSMRQILDLPIGVYFQNTERVMQLCNEITAEQCGFVSIRDSNSRPWYFPFLRNSIKPTIEIGNCVVIKESFKITEEFYTRKDQYTGEALSIRMPWYDDNDKIIGLFGCSIVKGKHPLAESLNALVSVNLLNINIGSYIHQRNPMYEKAKYLGLTKREKQCLHLTLRGKTCKQIARFLNISHRTVEKYQANLLEKYQCNTKYELICGFKHTRINSFESL